MYIKDYTKSQHLDDAVEAEAKVENKVKETVTPATSTNGGKQLNVVRCRAGAKLPIRATRGSAGLDITACLDTPITLKVGETVMVPSGLKMQVNPPSSVALLLFPRSGLASKHGITLANSVGVIDSDYTGEIMIPLINLGAEPFTITNGMRIVQLVIVPIVPTTIHEIDAIQVTTARGDGGFGHSGL